MTGFDESWYTVREETEVTEQYINVLEAKSKSVLVWSCLKLG